MKRVSTVRIVFPDGTKVSAKVTTESKKLLMRWEAEDQHNCAIDDVVAALRTVRYSGTAPLKNVTIS